MYASWCLCEWWATTCEHIHSVVRRKTWHTSNAVYQRPDEWPFLLECLIIVHWDYSLLIQGKIWTMSDHECHHEFWGGRKHKSGPFKPRFSTSIHEIYRYILKDWNHPSEITMCSSEFFVGASNSEITWLVYLDGPALSWHCNMWAVFFLLSTQGCKLEKIITWSEHNAQEPI